MPVVTKHSPGAKSNDIPETMHAAAIDSFGGPEALSIHSLPTPALDHGEVLIALETAGVGPWDAEMRSGRLPQLDASFPLVLGTDGAGRVAALGSHIRRFKIGDPVYAYSFANPKGGFYAEYVAVAEDNVAEIPKGLNMTRAGAIPATGLTALQGIDDALQVKVNDTVLIHGAAGGVGTLAVQFAKLRGARVLATATSADGLDLVRRLGADSAVDGRSGDIRAAARSFAPEGIHAVLGLAGGDALERCLDALKSGGRFAYPNGIEPRPKKRPGINTISYDAVAGVREFVALAMAVEAIHLQVPIAGTFDLGNAAEAHERLARRPVLGKIVLRIA